MPLGYTASFSTSHIRPYTGPKGICGATVYGTIGGTGPRGAIGPTGASGPTGPTGMKLVGTYLQTDQEKPAYNYYVLEFADQWGNYVTAAPRGLTGSHAPVIGTTGAFFNTLLCNAPVLDDLEAPCGYTGIFSGVTWVSPTFRPWGGHGGASGATLSFRSIGVSGDLELYKSGTIGPGVTYDTLGISGPDAAVQYGTVELQSEGEVAYLSDRKNVKDAYGLTFNDDTSLPEWGTIDVTFRNYSENFYIHGNPVTGVTKNPFVIDLKEGYGNVHQIFTPFSLSGISAEFHPSKNPIVSGPIWTNPAIGVTAEYGEAISITMIIDGGPYGISFSNSFYFSDDVRFTNGKDIVNCLSYDHCNSWFCTMSGIGFGASVSDYEFGSCCNTTTNSSCYDYMLYEECQALGEKYAWYPSLLCNDPACPCNVYDTDGSCCINVDDTGDTLCLEGANGANREDCLRFGGVWRNGVPCDKGYACNNPCGVFAVGACCLYDNGDFVECVDSMVREDCAAALGVYHGDGSFCSFVDCEEEIQTGACCISETTCQGPVTSMDCFSAGGVFMGVNTVCSGKDAVECDVCNQFPFRNSDDVDEEIIFRKRIITPNRLPKLSGVICDGKNEIRVSDIYKYVLDRGLSYVERFIPNGGIGDVCDTFSGKGNIKLQNISICLGSNKNLLGKSCINMTIPKGQEETLSNAFGGIVYSGIKCEEINCKELHGNNIIQTDNIFNNYSIGTNINNTTGRCRLQDGSIIMGCDKNYCENALGGRWKKSNIKENQSWNTSSSGGQTRKDNK